MGDRKAVIKSADMTEEMQQEATTENAPMKMEGPIHGRNGWVTQIATDPRSKDILLSACRAKIAILWQIDESGAMLHGKPIKSLHGHGHFVSDVVISSDRQNALAGSWDKTARLWDLHSGQTPRQFVSHTQDVLSVAFSSDNHQIVSGSRDKLLNTLAQCKHMAYWTTMGEANNLLMHDQLSPLQWVGGLLIDMFPIATNGRILPRFANPMKELNFGTDNERKYSTHGGNKTRTQLFIRMTNGKIRTHNLASSATIEQLKAEIKDKDGIPPDQQHLYYAGKHLNDDNLALSDYGIQAEATLQVLCPLIGGVKPRIAPMKVPRIKPSWLTQAEANPHIQPGPLNSWRNNFNQKFYPNSARRFISLRTSCPPISVVLHSLRSNSTGLYHLQTKYRQSAATLFEDNTVIPYNPYLLLKFGCHINIEYVFGQKACKYIFKYLLKGFEKAYVRVTPLRRGAAAEGQDEVYDYDEISATFKVRYMTAMEAYMRLHSYRIVRLSHQIYALSVHDEGGQTIVVEEGHEEQGRAAAREDTRLMAFFKLCATDPDAADLRYDQVPYHYTWNQMHRCWWPRRRPLTEDPETAKMFVRIYTVSAKRPELFAIRALLLNRKGPKSFEDLRTVDGKTFDTFAEAAAYLRLLESDDMFADAMRDACDENMSLTRLQHYFAMMLVHGQPSDPQKLFDTFLDEMRPHRAGRDPDDVQ